MWCVLNEPDVAHARACLVNVESQLRPDATIGLMCWLDHYIVGLIERNDGASLQLALSYLSVPNSSRRLSRSPNNAYSRASL